MMAVKISVAAVFFFSSLFVTTVAQIYPLVLDNHLSATSNSTCGGTPTNNCSSSALEQPPSLVFDGNHLTWWESSRHEEPVSLSIEPSGNLDLNRFIVSTVELRFLSSLPESIALYSQNLTLLKVYSHHCVPGPCYIYNSTTENDTTIVYIKVDATISAINLLLMGFTNNDTYYQVAEVTVSGYIKPGFFLPGIHHIRAEAENGVLSGGSVLVKSSNQTLFPKFLGQGFAILDLKQITHQSRLLQLNLQIYHETPCENLVIHYVNREIQGYLLRANISQNLEKRKVYFHVRSNLIYCSENCFSRAYQINCTNDLENGTVTIFMEVSSANFIMDYVAAIPGAFNSVLNLCGFGKLTKGECIHMALQQSLDLYENPLECMCSVNHSNGSICEEYGGQCPCIARDNELVKPVGKRCNLCPFTYYITDEGCTECGCPNNAHCSYNGQCECPAYTTGLRCDSCVPGSFGNPTDNIPCQICQCNGTGAMGCNSTNGECHCHPNVGGDNCSFCQSGFYNFSLNGCQPCECDTDGSLSNGACDTNGTCSCKAGYEGEKCNQCSSGYFKTPAAGCVACNCSGRTNSCIQNPGNTISTQELCSCSSEYTGDSCEFCSVDHYLSNDSNTCVPCNCTSSMICNNMTGQCFILILPPPPLFFPPPMNCTENTTGDDCHLCAEGYYNASTDSEFICAQCPCHSNSSYNSSCFVIGSQPYCHCLPGHDGPLCDSCTAGYYGIPPLYPCSTCECSGNINANDENACNRTNGVCLLCLNNSTGSQCELCADGYYGDALNQMCQPCGCFVDGSINGSVCDRFTGVCQCLPGVGGKCTHCKEGYWNFQPGVGCEECSCNSTGRNGSTCHSITGQCACKQNVIGRTCDSCNYGYFNFTEDGCQNCLCDSLGSVNNSCHPLTGQCICNANATGTKCESCIEYYYLTDEGCIECDSCVQSLRKNISYSNDTLTDTDALVMSAMQLVVADTLDLTVLIKEVEEIWAMYNESRINLTEAQNSLNNTDNMIFTIRDSLEGLFETVNNLLANATSILPETSRVLMEATDLNNILDVHFESARGAMDYINALQPKMMSLVIDSDNLLANISSLTNKVLAITLSNQSYDINDFRLYYIDSISADAIYKYNQALVEANSIRSLNTTATNLLAQLSSLHSAIQQLDKNVSDIHQAILIAQYTAGNLTLAVNEIHSIINTSVAVINDTEVILSNISETLSLNNLSAIHSLLSDSSDNLFGSGGGSWIPLTIPDQLLLLNSSVSQLKLSLESSISQYQLALSHGTNITIGEQAVCSILSASLNAGNEAVDAIMDYTFVIDTLASASNLTAAANVTLNDILVELAKLMADGLVSSSNMALQDGITLNASLQALQVEISSQILQYTSLLQILNSYSADVNYTKISLDSLHVQYQQLLANTNNAIQLVPAMLSNVNQSILEANAIYQSMILTHYDLINNINSISQTLDGVAIDAMVIDASAVEINKTAAQIEADLNERKAHLDQISANETALKNELNEARSSMTDLQRRLLEAQEAAALIDIALRFHGNGTATYEPKFSPQNYSTHVYLYLRPDSLSSGILFSDSQQNNTLEIENGVIIWNTGDESIQTDSSSLSVNEWYKVLASSEVLPYDRTSLFLSVAPLQDSSNSTVTITKQVNSTTPQLSFPITLGGSPDGHSYFAGCIDRVIINRELPLPLLTPNASTDIPQACGPRILSESVRAMESGAWFLGQSRLELPYINISSEGISVSFAFRTYFSEAHLAQINDTSLSVIILLYINNSSPHLLISLDTDMLFLTVNASVSDGYWHNISFTVAESIAHFSVDEYSDTADLSSYNLTSPVNFTFGGNSALNLPSFAGCISSLSIENEFINLTKAAQNIERVEISNCPLSVSPGTRFMGTGSAVFPIDDFFNSLSFSFRTQQIAAAIVYMSSSSLSDRLIVTLFHTHIRVQMINYENNIILTSRQVSLNDNQWHHVTIELKSNLKLTVDGLPVSADTAPNNTNYLLLSSVEIGAIPHTVEESLAAPTDNFRGCIRDFAVLTITQQYYDLHHATLSDGVALYGCHGDIIEPTMPTDTITPTIGSGSDYTLMPDITTTTYSHSFSASLPTDSSSVSTSTPTTDSSSVFTTTSTTDSSSVFTSTPTTDSSSAFTTTSTTDSSSVFTPTTTDVFISAPTTQVFTPASTTDSSSVFTSTPTTDSSSVFTSTPTTDSSSVFTSTPTTDSSSVFTTTSTTDSSSVFTPTTTDIFISAPTTQVFSPTSTTDSSSVFTSTPTTDSSSVFTTTSTTDSSSVFTTTSTTDSSSVFTTTSTTDSSSAFTTTSTTDSSSVFTPTTTDIFISAPTTQVFSPTSTTDSSSVFTSTPTTDSSSVFTTTSTTDSSSVFTPTPTTDSSSVFTPTTTDIFISAPTTQVFTPTSTTDSSSVFTSTPTTDSSSVFTTTSTTDSSSVFTPTPTTDSSSVFTPTTTDIFISAPTTQVFTPTSTTDSSSVFTSTPITDSSSVFTTTSTTDSSSVFTTTSTTDSSSVFTPTTTDIFISAPTTQVFTPTSTTDSSSVFTSTPNTDSSSVFTTTSTTDSSSVFTPTPTTDSSSAFTTTSTTDSSSVFTPTTTEVFISAPTTQVFTPTPTTDSSSVFTSTPTTDSSSVFTTTSTTDSSSVFTTTSTTDSSSVFTTTLTTEVFISAPTTQVFTPTPTTDSSSVFTPTPTTDSSSVFTSTPTTDSSSVFTTTSTTDSSSVFTTTSTTDSSSVFTTTSTTDSSLVFTTTSTTDSSSVFTTTSTTDSSSVFTTTSTTAVSTTTAPSPTVVPDYSIGLDGERHSFLSYTNPADIVHSFNIVLVFRTVSSNAILLFIQSQDYMALELRNGHLYYSYDLGAGPVFITSNQSLPRFDDDRNHTVNISRNGINGILIVDGTEYNGFSLSGFTQLNIDTSLLYVGGVSPLVSTNILYGNSLLAPPSALGCFYSLEINGQVINLKSPLAASGTVSCSDSYNDHISFRGSGYARLVEVYNPLQTYGISLQFRTNNCTGLLLYNTHAYLGDHTALELYEGKVRFIFDNGHGPGIMEYTPSDSLCNGDWHSIVVSKNGITGTLIVDGQPPVTTTISNTGFVAVNTNAPLYAGGVPDDLLVRYTVMSAVSFQGCMRNIELTDSRGTVRSINLADVYLSSPSIQLYTCHI